MIRKLTFITIASAVLQLGLAHVAAAQSAQAQLDDCLAGFHPKPYDLFALTQGNPDAMCFTTLDAINAYLKTTSCANFKCDQAATSYYSTPDRSISIGHPSGVCHLPNGDTVGISLDDVTKGHTLYNRWTSVPLGNNPTPRQIAERMALNVGAPLAAVRGERYGNGTVAGVMSENGQNVVANSAYAGAPLPKGLGEVVATTYGSVYIVQRYAAQRKLGPVTVGGSSTNIMPYGSGAAVIGAEEAAKKIPGASTAVGVFVPFILGNSLPEGHAETHLGDHITVGAKTFATVVIPNLARGIQKPRAYAQVDFSRPGFSVSGYVDSHLLADIHAQKGSFGLTVGEDHGETPFRVDANVSSLTKHFKNIESEVFGGRAPRMANLDFGNQAGKLVDPYSSQMLPYPDSLPRPAGAHWYAGFGLTWTSSPKESKPGSSGTRSVAATPVLPAESSPSAAETAPAQAGSAAGTLPPAEQPPN